MNKWLSYYQKELSDLKQYGRLFANRFPKIAGRLGIVEGETEDPHVSRLIESFALLTSRIHQRLDDDVPEVIDALLSALAPQFLRPLPSVCIVMVEPDPQKSGITGKNRLEAETALFTRHSEPLACQFQTVYPITLLPLSMHAAELYFDSDKLSWELILNIKIWPGATLTSDTLRLFLHGPSNAVNTLYTLLCSEKRDLNLRHNGIVTPLSNDALRPVGFATEDALLTRDTRIDPIHILLLDYFWFPQKFSFIDIQLPAGFTAAGNEHIELQAVFNHHALTEKLEKLAPLVDKNFFRLNCSPAVNLFSQRAEPISLTDAIAEYPIIPDSRHHDHIDIWAINRVYLQRKTNNQVENCPLLPLIESGGNPHAAEDIGLYWQWLRREIPSKSAIEYQSLVAFSERQNARTNAESGIVGIDLICTNDGLAHQFQYGSTGGDFELNVPIAGLKISALTHPTRQISPVDKSVIRWRFLSQLTLNHQLLDGELGIQRLKETLSLYIIDDSQDRSRLLSLIQGLLCEPLTTRLISNDPHSLARGISLTLTFSREALHEPEYFLLCSLLDRLLALYAPVNSFTRLTTCIEQETQTRRIWPIRAGRLSWL
ncbi:type VI secretion system baseplate subunit TssF [Enterobacter sp. Cy-643]|uniref:type VI secretion system baseplate subunit TssF n=1 Tax=Enterobacter sp. Cy-643 TaxID=2608346 RepID=UPI001423F3EC|nr:type VI secretion system baseplate subunit TssF [Enterobacter sp. Cy-643]NIF32445.1 type VI secretion system baseplate subunit TssF [Enterobacter sp. Cy-643]